MGAMLDLGWFEFGAKQMKNQVRWPNPGSGQWSNRLLIGSLIGISYLTLFPFRFDFSILHSSQASPFLLGPTLKHGIELDFFLNVLLFVPFGFALSCRLRERGAHWAKALVLAFVAGALVSYAVELLQFFIPTRNSAWDDVTSNSLGSLAGFFVFVFCGDALLRHLSKYGEVIEGWMSPLLTAALLLVYLGLCFGVSIPLQKQTRLSNWDAACELFVGNDASGHHAWKGQVSRLQIWNRALSEGLVQRLTVGGPTPDAEPGLLASYDFNTPAPYSDQTKLSPALYWIPANPSLNNNIPTLDGTSWLGTISPVEELTRKIQGTSQFTVRIFCVPAEIHATDGRIVSLSQSAENVNLHLRQEGTSLFLFFLNPLSQTHSVLAWRVPGVFNAGQGRDIVASYDGSDASIYLDGNRVRQTYRLSPGASLAHHFFIVWTANLGGYIVVYETLIFLPGGFLIGMAARGWATWKTAGRLLLAAGLLLPPVLLELLLVWVSGREILAGNVFLSLCLSIAGALLINADCRARKPLPISLEPVALSCDEE